MVDLVGCVFIVFTVLFVYVYICKIINQNIYID